MFKGKKTSVFWFGLLIVGLASVILFGLLWFIIVFDQPAQLDIYWKTFVPPIVGSVVFILIGWFMMESGTKTEEQGKTQLLSQRERTSDERMVRRSVATRIVLVIIAVGIIGVLFTSGIYVRYVDDHHHTDEDYVSLAEENSRFENLLLLREEAVWIDNRTISQAAGTYTSWTFPAFYAGYVGVLIHTSNASSIHVRLMYHSYVDFDQEIVTIAGGGAQFPVLPAGQVQVQIGNNNTVNGATETVTIKYYY